MATFEITRHAIDPDLVFLVRDITAQRRIEQERNFFARFPATNPNPVLRVSFYGKIEYANDASRNLFDLCGCRVGDSLPEAWRRALMTSIDKRSMTPVEIPVGDRHFEFVPAMIEGSGYFYLYGRDVTEEWLAKRRVQLAAQVSESVLDAVMVTNAEGRIVQINPAFTDMTGYGPDEAVGRAPDILRSGRHDHKFYAEMWKRLCEEGRWRGEIWNRRRNGEVFPCLARISTIFDRDGSIANYVAIYTDISEAKDREQVLNKLAYHDALTGLPNRLLLQDRLRQALAQAGRRKGQVAVLFIDLDGFKAVNDELGHDAGDTLLMEVARRLKQNVREIDTVARLAGDEFVLILGELSGREAVEALAGKLCRAIAEPYPLGETAARVTVSMGIAFYPDDADTGERLVEAADAAMYRAKAQGKNRYEFSAATK